MSEFKASEKEVKPKQEKDDDEIQQSFGEIMLEEKKRLKILDKQIEKEQPFSRSIDPSCC